MDRLKILGEELKKNTDLLVLELAGNQIENNGVQHVLEMFKENSTLMCLFLERNQIGDECARNLSNVLKNNSSLLYLDIRWNHIGDEGVEHLSNMLIENSTIIHMDMRWNEIEDAGAQTLYDMLKDNSILLHLDFSDKNVRAKHLVSAIREELNSRNMDPSPLSFAESRLFLQSLFDISSWTSVRGEYINCHSCQLCPEVWGEILSFISNDQSSLEESFLIPDLRCGFCNPVPISSFCASEAPLLSMIPLIECHFQIDVWTMERLYRLGWQLASAENE